MKKNYGKNRFPKNTPVIINHQRSNFHGKEGICEGPANKTGTKFFVRFGINTPKFVFEGRSIEVKGGFSEQPR